MSSKYGSLGIRRRKRLLRVLIKTQPFALFAEAWKLEDTTTAACSVDYKLQFESRSSSTYTPITLSEIANPHDGIDSRVVSSEHNRMAEVIVKDILAIDNYLKLVYGIHAKPNIFVGDKLGIYLKIHLHQVEDFKPSIVRDQAVEMGSSLADMVYEKSPKGEEQCALCIIVVHSHN